jgi:hypothetical protein
VDRKEGGGQTGIENEHIQQKDALRQIDEVNKTKRDTYAFQSNHMIVVSGR